MIFVVPGGSSSKSRTTGGFPAAALKAARELNSCTPPGVMVIVGVAVKDGVNVMVVAAVGVGVAVPVGEGVSVAELEVAVTVAVEVAVGVDRLAVGVVEGVGASVGLRVVLTDGVIEGEVVAVGVGVTTVWVGVGEVVGVGEIVGVGEGPEVGKPGVVVTEGVRLGVGEVVGVGVGGVPVTVGPGVKVATGSVFRWASPSAEGHRSLGARSSPSQPRQSPGSASLLEHSRACRPPLQPLLSPPSA